MSAAADLRRAGDLRRTRNRRDTASFLAVTVLVALALGAGLVVRASVERAVQPVDQGGLQADLPSGWVVLPAGGDRLLTAYDPLDPDLRYAVATIGAEGPAGGTEPTPEDAAAIRSRELGRLLEGFTIRSEGPATLGSVATYHLRYTFVDRAPGAAGTAIEAVEHYLPAGALLSDARRIVAIILEAPVDAFEAAMPAFDGFARELAERAGTSAAIPHAPDGSNDSVRAADRRLAAIGDADGGAAIPPAAAADLVGATVQILMTATIGGQEQAYGWGSGTIISTDGLILTNAHVAMPSAPGRGIYEWDPTPVTDPEDLVIAIIESEDRPAVPTYRATVLAADGYLDAAVIRIDRALDGRPLAAASLRLPSVPLGDSEALHVGDPLTIVGFPGIGGDTISLSSGRASGFLGDDRIGPRAWIKTDAVVSSGNSGGLAANDAGQLVGIPTRGPDDAGAYSLLRPIALVAPIIDAARTGRGTVDSPYLVPATGRERLQLDAWTTNGQACPAVDRMTSYPSGIRSIVASFEHAGFATGEDLISQWRYNGEIVVRTAYRFADGAEAGGCYFGEVYYDRGLPDGAYLVELFAGPTLEPVGAAQTTIGAAGGAGSATLGGVVIDADSGRPLSGAVIFLLTPGTDLAAWIDRPQESQVVSFAKSATDGTFLVLGLSAGTSYPAIALAQGYVTAGGTIGPVLEGDNELISPIGLTRAAP